MKKILAYTTLLTITAIFTAGTIDLNNLYNYALQPKPSYITKDNTNTNTITNEGATLGRVLFYDAQLSTTNTISCATCHQQQFAFSDTNIASTGVNGQTTRHSMRLINARFAQSPQFFWDKRAPNLEIQTTQPIKDHTEMGYSGTMGAPNFVNLIAKLNTRTYYKPLFTAAFGDTLITEPRIQKALAQFIRSIQSFDTKYDSGRSQVSHDTIDFPNYNLSENLGKKLFITKPIFDPTSTRTAGGLGCATCHRAPEFDIDPNSGNNGISSTIAPGGFDTTNHRSPTLRNIIQANGNPYTPFMHDGSMHTIEDAISAHYGNLSPIAQNTTTDPRLMPFGQPQKLNITVGELKAIINFLKTLEGHDVLTNPKWSNPFDAAGNITIISPQTHTTTLPNAVKSTISLHPNPCTTATLVSSSQPFSYIKIYTLQGKAIASHTNPAAQPTATLNTAQLPNGTYIAALYTASGKHIASTQIIKK